VSRPTRLSHGAGFRTGDSRREETTWEAPIDLFRRGHAGWRCATRAGLWATRQRRGRAAEPVRRGGGRGGQPDVADWGNHCIVVFSAAGGAVRTFGRGGSGAGELKHPHGVAVDGAGNVFVVDWGNHRIVDFSAAGVAVRTFGRESRGAGELKHPHGVAVDGAGNVFVADYGNHRIVDFSAAGVAVRTFGRAGRGAGELQGPHGVAVDGASNVFVADYGSHLDQDRISVPL
jgi:tripartite motif-containing protein 71